VIERTLKSDVVAGLSVAGLMLPEAVAYAGIAGLPPGRAIAAAFAGALVYPLIGRSRVAIVTTTSSSAAILAATLALAPGGVAGKALMVTLITGAVGLLFLAAAAARLGAITGFIARPVVRGFAFGLAVTIILRQLPALVGVPLHAPDLAALAGDIVRAAPRWNLPGLAVGAAAIAALLLLRRFRGVPGAFLVLAAGIGASFLFRLPQHGVAVVGPIRLSLGWPAAPALSGADYSRMLQLAAPLLLILFAESWGTIRTFALKRGELVGAPRELAALGAANLVSALVQGMPVAAGFSAGAATEAAGAATRAASVIAALGLAVLVFGAGPLVAQLPEPVLAAVVVVALSHALDPGPLLRLWVLKRDRLAALAAAAGVLVFGVVDGMLIAIALSVVVLMQRLASPVVSQLGRLGSTRDYVDIARHPDAGCPAGLAIWRPAEPLFFANAERILALLAAKVRAQRGLKAVVVSLEDTFDLDSTALDALAEFDAEVRAGGVDLQLARVHDHVRDVLSAGGATDLLQRCSYSVADAVERARRVLPRPDPDAAHSPNG
jgi:MFS superfamily sulfate permease-like transporter